MIESHIKNYRYYNTISHFMVAALGYHDQTTADHVKRVEKLSLATARRMDIVDPLELWLIGMAALNHDDGKFFIPYSILAKPAPLEPKEWAKIKSHPYYSSLLLSLFLFPKTVIDMVYAHHEKVDGSGYPRGLKRESIPQGALIICAVDHFDATTNRRPYNHRDIKNPQQALVSMRKQIGMLFDASVISALSMTIDENSPIE